MKISKSVTAKRLDPILSLNDEIFQFAEKYDPRPFHIDEAAAARSVFAGLSASAAHTFAIFYSLTNKLHPPIRAIAALGYDELRLPNPVRPDDELDLDVRVLEKRESKSKSDRGIFRFRAFLRNQRRETVLECISNILVARRPHANAPTRIEKTDGP